MSVPVADDGRRTRVDLPTLKALAHPLRVSILHALTAHGPQTVTALASRLEESTASLSYHVRQLERAGFVREIANKGTGRERWWERAVSDIEVLTPELSELREGRAAASTVLAAWNLENARLLRDFIEHGTDSFSRHARDAARLSTRQAKLTVTELRELTTEIDALIAERLARSTANADDALRVVVQFHAFPVADRKHHVRKEQR